MQLEDEGGGTTAAWLWQLGSSILNFLPVFCYSPGENCCCARGGETDTAKDNLK